MGISTEYDGVFEKFRGSIPLSFLRVLAFSQSQMNTKKSIQDSAGLFMISEAAMKAYDKKFPSFMPPSPHKLTDLTNPSFNTAIAVWIISNIVKYYATRYPKTMTENWNSPLYVAIIAYSFTVGYSEPKGVGSALKKFESNPSKLSLDSLAQVAKELGLGKAKYNANVLNRARNVGNLYVADLGGKAPVNAPSSLSQPQAKGGSGLLLALPVVGLGLYLVTKKK